MIPEKIRFDELKSLYESLNFEIVIMEEQSSSLTPPLSPVSLSPTPSSPVPSSPMPPSQMYAVVTYKLGNRTETFKVIAESGSDEYEFLQAPVVVSKLNFCTNTQNMKFN
jgi:hypothetical protein